MRRTATALLPALLAAAACAAPPVPPDASADVSVGGTVEEACAPPDTSILPANVDVSSLAGVHRLRLFADEGPAVGAAAEGELELRAFADDAPAYGGQPAALYGWTDVALDSVGAIDTGDSTSQRVEAPGAVVLQWTQAGAARPSVVLRLGARSNRTDALLFDGAYTVLRLFEIGAVGFAGRWESGAPGRPTAGGRFCAERVAPPGS